MVATCSDTYRKIADRITVTGITDKTWREHYLKLLHNGNQIKTTTYTTEEYNVITLTEVMKLLTF
jgi:hypothetical protein